jgi:hypothetical protein
MSTEPIIGASRCLPIQSRPLSYTMPIGNCRSWSGSSAIRLSPPRIRACGWPALDSSRRLPNADQGNLARVSDAGRRQWEACQQRVELLPCQAALTPPAQHSVPAAPHLIVKAIPTWPVARQPVVGIVPSQYTAEPAMLRVDRRVHAAPQLRLHLLQLPTDPGVAADRGRRRQPALRARGLGADPAAQDRRPHEARDGDPRCACSRPHDGISCDGQVRGANDRTRDRQEALQPTIVIAAIPRYPPPRALARGYHCGRRNRKSVAQFHSKRDTTQLSRSRHCDPAYPSGVAAARRCSLQMICG